MKNMPDTLREGRAEGREEKLGKGVPSISKKRSNISLRRDWYLALRTAGPCEIGGRNTKREEESTPGKIWWDLQGGEMSS